MTKDPFGDRMKSYENQESFPEILDSNLPFYVRLDGRRFSKVTEKLPKPFCTSFRRCMETTGLLLFRQFRPDISYVCSDEISLGWKTAPIPEGQTSRYEFSGRRTKLLTLMSGFASTVFREYTLFNDQHFCGIDPFSLYPHFDARGYQPPNDIELANSFLWRMLEYRRNAVSAIAQTMFSQKELQGVKTETLKKMICEKLGVSRLENAYTLMDLCGEFNYRTKQHPERIGKAYMTFEDIMKGINNEPIT